MENMFLNSTKSYHLFSRIFSNLMKYLKEKEKTFDKHNKNNSIIKEILSVIQFKIQFFHQKNTKTKTI